MNENERKRLEHLEKLEKQRELFWEDLKDTIIGAFLASLIALPLIVIGFLLLSPEMQERVRTLLSFL